MDSCLTEIASVGALIGGMSVGAGVFLMTCLYWIMTRP
jgi:hypothetical protein